MRKLFGITLFLLLIFSISANLFAVGVKPLSLNLIGKPGSVLDFKVTVNPSEKPGIVRVTLCKVTQNLDGKQNYEPVEAGKFPTAGWFSYPSILKVTPGNPGEIEGKIKIPFDAKGDYNMMLMVSPESEIVKVQGINIAVRYGVQLLLQVDRPGIRPTAEVNDLDLVKGENGMPEIHAKAKNTSVLDYNTYAYATIRNSQRKLIQRIDLLPETYWDKSNYGDPVLFPGSELIYTGKVIEFLAPGLYELRLFYRYADSGQILQTKTINIAEGEYKFPVYEGKKIKVSPESIRLEGRPGTMAMKAIRFENQLDKPVMIVIDSLDIEPNYTYSIFNNTEIDLKGGRQFTLKAHQVAMKIVTVRFGPKGPIQGNYGNLKIRVYTDENKPNLIEEFTESLSAIPMGDKKRAVEFTDLTGERSGDEYIVSAMFKNTGNIDIAPEVSLQLQDKDDRIIARIALGTEKGDKNSILPERMASVSGTLTHIKPGDYKAIMKAREGDSELGSSKFKLKIK